MFKSIAYVVKENVKNFYRTFSIAKYELMAELRDSKFGLFWSFASPAIQILTYFLVFGIGMNRRGHEGIPWIPWAVVGFSAWWYARPVIVRGCTAVYSKMNIITRMKFPISILPATLVMKEFFNHLCMLAITFAMLLVMGFYPNWYWLQLFYYMICLMLFLESLTLITSIITMLWRDMKELVNSLMRLLMYLSPVLWPAMFEDYPTITFILKLNPFQKKNF